MRMKKSGRNARDVQEMREAAQTMDENRAKLTERKDWSAVKEIRKWRELRRLLVI